MQKQRYRPEIDGLRALAVSIVVIYHAFPARLPGGFIGVDVFFVISGFLITTLILENFREHTFSFREFYFRRIIRLFPALVIVVFSTIIFGKFILFPDELNQLARYVIASTGFVTNFLSWSEAGYFDSLSSQKPLLHLWSLGIEEQFYIFWPLMLWFARKSVKRIFTTIFLLLLLSFIFNISIVYSNQLGAFYSPISRLWELATGSVLAFFTVRYQNSSSLKSPPLNTRLNHLGSLPKNGNLVNLVGNLLGLIGITLVFYGSFTLGDEKNFPGFFALVPVIGSTLIIFSTFSQGLLSKILSLRPLVGLGLISYPLYLWHWPVLVFARMVYGERISTTITCCAVVIAVLLSYLTFKLIEKPIKLSRGSINAKASFLSLTMFCVFMVGIQFAKVTPVTLAAPNGDVTIKVYTPTITRDGYESAIGRSLRWFQGKDDWLFLGNAFDRTIEKLTLSIKPNENVLDETTKRFDLLASKAEKLGTHIALLVGPSKPSVYTEYLPAQIELSKTRYLDFFLQRLRSLQNLTVFDPTKTLIKSKDKSGLLYSRTDTHWNDKGAFVAYRGLLGVLGIQIPKVEFKAAPFRPGDLLSISGITDYPIQEDDNWNISWEGGETWTSPDGNKSTNEAAVSGKYIWVVGDSFSVALKPFIFATFKEVSYLGQMSLELLSEELQTAERKPDLIIVVQAERRF